MYVISSCLFDVVRKDFFQDKIGAEHTKCLLPFSPIRTFPGCEFIEAMKMKREDVYISNAVKCRPPGNRTPLPLEVNTGKNLLLLKEIDIIQPKIICTLGSPATKALLGDHVQISRGRGVFAGFQCLAVMPTYHPAYLLRNPAEKRTVWEDMKKIMAKLAELKS